MSMSCKQKLVTKSSTEAKLVVVDDAMTFVMWAKYFFQDQAKDLPDTSKLKDLGNHNVIEQNNTRILAQYSWNKMGSGQVRSEPDTSISGISMSLTR